MTGFDEKLRSELGRAAHAAAPDQGDVLADVTRRRAHRDVLRKIQLSALSIVVITASVAGVVALRSRFVDDAQVPGATAFGATGLVTTCEVDSVPGTHLCSIPAEALLRGAGPADMTLLTDEPGEVIESPAVSPDGSRVVFNRGAVTGPTELWIARIDGSGERMLLPASDAVREVTWSPGSESIAFFDAPTSQDERTRTFGLLAVDDLVPGPLVRVSLLDADLWYPTGLDWSPDGHSLAFSATASRSDATGDVFTLKWDNRVLRNLTRTEETSEIYPAWSPDGSSIAYSSDADGSIGVWLMDADGSGAHPADGAEQGGLPSWTPDGRSIAFIRAGTGSDIAIYAVAASGGMPILIAQPAQGFSWIPPESPSPTPQVSTVSPEPTGEPSAEPITEGGDIGLDVNVCEAQAADGLALLPGDGLDTAWAGFLVNDAGRCARDSERQRWIVAVDVTGDRRADAWTDNPLINCPYVGCWPLGASDLDADGDGELVVSTGFSEADHGYFTVDLDPGTGDPVIESIIVSSPGHLPAGILPGEPLVTTAGGDEGYASWIRCDGYPADPVLVWAKVSGVVDPQPGSLEEWHEIHVRLEDDGTFHVIDATDLELPWDDPPPFELSTGPTCGGLDFNPGA